MSEITITGLQHIGLPTNDMKATVAFYEKLGFTVAYRTMNNGEEVVFLKQDVEKAWEEVKALGITPIETEIQALPFWENGVRYFNIYGPNREKIEFSQML